MLIFLGLAGFAFIRFGYFPVVIVNSKFLSENRYNRVLEANLRSLSGDAEVGHNEIKKLSLQQMIEDELIYSEAVGRLGENIRKIEEPGRVRAMLADNLRAEKVIFDDWLHLARSNARVIILVSDFSWQNGKVIADCGSKNIC